MGMDRTIAKRKWPPRRIAAFAGAGVFVVAVAWVFVFRFGGSTLNVEAERLTISTVTRGPFLEYIPVIGNVMPINTFVLETTEGGRVEKIFQEAGSMVKKGEPLLELVNTELLLQVMWRDADFVQMSNQLRQSRLNMEQYQQQLRQIMNTAETELAKAKSAFDRYGGLHEQGLVSDFEFEKIRLDYEHAVKNRDLLAESQKKEMEFREEQLKSLTEQMARMESNLAISKQKLESLVVRAPISGQLTSLDAEIGQFKAMGIKIGQIDVLDAFKVRADIEEHYITRVEPRKTGRFDLAGKDYDLTVRRVFPEVRDGRFQVDFDFVGSPPPDIRRGQTLHIRLELSGLEEAVLLPRGGFFQTTGGNWVYLLDASGKTALKRAIRLGLQNPDMFQVLEGLQPGDRVVTSSYETFGDMDRLVLK